MKTEFKSMFFKGFKEHKRYKNKTKNKRFNRRDKRSRKY